MVFKFCKQQLLASRDEITTTWLDQYHVTHFWIWRTLSRLRNQWS